MKPLPKPSIVVVLEELGGRVIGADRGGWRKATCVLHEDRTPSASVNEDICRFRCHSCGFSGDAIDLIMEVEGIEFREAVERAGEFGDENDAQRATVSSLAPRARSRAGRRNWSAPWTNL